jgi:hypothetical protein
MTSKMKNPIADVAVGKSDDHEDLLGKDQEKEITTGQKIHQALLI